MTDQQQPRDLPDLDGLTDAQLRAVARRAKERLAERDAARGGTLLGVATIHGGEVMGQPDP